MLNAIDSSLSQLSADSSYVKSYSDVLEYYTNIVLVYFLFALFLSFPIIVCRYFCLSNKLNENIGFNTDVFKRDVTVLRDMKKQLILPNDLVVGDIIYLTLGMAIPADIRIFDCTQDMKVNYSLLTGNINIEPFSVDWRSSNTESPTNANNMCFYGGFVINGKGFSL